MKWISIPVIFLAARAAGPAVYAQTTHPWEVVEMTCEARGEYTNSYVDGLPDRKAPLARATFRGTSGAAREMRCTLAMFWDGGKTWKARFAPPAAGEWSWSTASQDPGLDGATGKMQVVEWTDAEKQANPARRGFIRVSREGPRAGRYFEYADGTPFLWIGDTWWNWTKRSVIFHPSHSGLHRVNHQVRGNGFGAGEGRKVVRIGVAMDLITVVPHGLPILQIMPLIYHCLG